MNTPEELIFKYVFKLSEDKEIIYDLHLDGKTLDLISPTPDGTPEWAEQKYNTCKMACPYTDICPVAKNLAPVLHHFSSTVSYDLVDMVVETNERTYTKDQFPIQRSLSALMGIIMVTSGCPYLDKLRPMVQHHLPFASVEETIDKASCMYLKAQYFRYQRGGQPDWSIKGLVKIYDDINQVNIDMVKRLQTASTQDASLNAIVVLSCFAQMVPLSIDTALSEFAHLYDKFLP
jgi:hypothetical protein